MPGGVPGSDVKLRAAGLPVMHFPTGIPYASRVITRGQR